MSLARGRLDGPKSLELAAAARLEEFCAASGPT